MKKIFLVILFFLLSASPVKAVTNLFDNPDFDNWSSPTNADNWVETFSGLCGSFSQATTSCHDTDNCMKIDQTSNSVPCLLEQDMTGLATSTGYGYTFSFQVKLASTTTSTEVGLFYTNSSTSEIWNFVQKQWESFPDYSYLDEENMVICEVTSQSEYTQCAYIGFDSLTGYPKGDSSGAAQAWIGIGENTHLAFLIDTATFTENEPPWYDIAGIPLLSQGLYAFWFEFKWPIAFIASCLLILFFVKGLTETGQAISKWYNKL